jgi:hypothetical protein
VNKVPFHPANVAPMLLALAAWVGRYDTHVATLGWRMRMHLVLPFTPWRCRPSSSRQR